jgi:hypothetical protein
MEDMQVIFATLWFLISAVASNYDAKEISASLIGFIE